MTVGELGGVDVQGMLDFVNPDRHELQMGFSFGHVNCGEEPGNRLLLLPWKLSELKKTFSGLARWFGI